MESGIHFQAWLKHIRCDNGGTWFSMIIKFCGEQGQSAGLVIKRSWVRVLGRTVAEFYSPGSPCYGSSTKKELSHSAKSAGGMLQRNTNAPYVCGFARSDVA